MSWEEYLDLFDIILDGKITHAPYDNPTFVDYVSLNKARTKRWLKRGEVLDDARQIIDQIDQDLQWYLITEPWCGDAAHNNPFIYKLCSLNDKNHLNIILRDTETDWIDNYLTNGGRSIPKLIVRDKNGNDLFTWGPRPKACQELVEELKDNGTNGATSKKLIQEWYNKDNGRSVQRELIELIKDHFGTRS